MTSSEYQYVEDIMTSPVFIFQSSDPILKVERGLVEQKISGAPVMKDGKMTGIVSRSDFVRMLVLLDSLDGYIADETQGTPETRGNHIVPFSERFSTLTAEDLMTSQVITCAPSTPIKEAASLMHHNHVHRIVVVKDHTPIGMVESLDLVKLLADE